jgi:hypothetical protein
MKTIDVSKDGLDWHRAKFKKPPMDVPIVAQAPMGNISVHLGRELLDWADWLTLDEFNAQILRKLQTE